MSRLFTLFCGLTLFWAFPVGLSREPLQPHSGPSEETEEGSFQPDLHIFPPIPPSVSEDSEKCTIPADLSFLSSTIQSGLDAALGKIPCRFLQSLRTVEVIADKEMPRALAGKYTLKLREDALDNPEFTNLILHELGHITDLGGLTGTSTSGKSEFRDGSLPIYNDDISVLFYRISWEDSTTRKAGSHPEDFVSGYARSDPFEDFAESLLCYRMHGQVFRQWAHANASVKAKYDFFKEHVFGGVEFESGDVQFEPDVRPWDMTKA